MTARAPRKADATGRSTGSLLRPSRHMKIAEPFTPHRRSFLESHALSVVSLSARRILDRLEVEHLCQGGAENGELVCTYLDFLSAGVHEKGIAPALRELEALGFIEIKRGRGGNAEYRIPSIYRLTYLPTARGKATDEWSRVKSEAEAKAIAKKARDSLPATRAKGGRSNLPEKEAPQEDSTREPTGGNHP